jgi:hypothetical protein
MEIPWKSIAIARCNSFSLLLSPFFFPFLDSMGEDTDKDQQDSKFPTRNWKALPHTLEYKRKGLDKQKQGQSVRRGVTTMHAHSKSIKATNPCTDWTDDQQAYVWTKLIIMAIRKLPTPCPPLILFWPAGAVMALAVAVHWHGDTCGALRASCAEMGAGRGKRWIIGSVVVMLIGEILRSIWRNVPSWFWGQLASMILPCQSPIIKVLNSVLRVDSGLRIADDITDDKFQ